MNYLIPAILAFLFALLLWLIKRDKFLLVYDLTESDIFPSNSRNGKYFIIKVKNKGNKVIEESIVKFSFTKGEIQKHSISENDLISDEKVSSNIYNCKIPILNPKEIVQFTITTESDSDFENPDIHIRAKGVNGQEESPTENSLLNTIIYPMLVGITIALISIMLIQRHIFKEDNGSKEILQQIQEVKSSLKIDSTKIQSSSLVRQNKVLDSIISVRDSINKLISNGYPEREDNIFVLFNKAGLSDLFPDYITSISETTYKNTAFYLFQNYLIDTKRKNNYIAALKNLSQIDDVAITSKGTIYYLLYKITSVLI